MIWTTEVSDRRQVQGKTCIYSRTRAVRFRVPKYECWNFNSGNYLFTTDTK